MFDDILMGLIKTAGGVAGAAAVVQITRLGNALVKRVGGPAANAWKKDAAQLAAKAIAHAEEWAFAQVKKGLKKPLGEQKLAKSVEFFMDHGSWLLTRIGDEKVASTITAILGTQRAQVLAAKLIARDMGKAAKDMGELATRIKKAKKR